MILAPINIRDVRDSMEGYLQERHADAAQGAYAATLGAGIDAYADSDGGEDGEALAASAIRRAASPAFMPVYESFYTEVVPHFAEVVYGELNGRLFGSGFIVSRGLVDDWVAAALQFLETFVGDAITGISNSTIRALQGVLQVSFNEGEGIAQAIRRLRAELPGWSRQRAELWVRTELVAAANFGAMAGARSTDFETEKGWITAIDGRERDAHRAANGQRRKLDEPFDVGGEAMMQPGDPKASLRNRARCRCAVAIIPV